jgi:hypothetical protein
MPVYRLMPVEGTESSPQWRASSIKPNCLWVQARNEHEARSAVARATAVSTWQGLQSDPPWYDRTLVACENDREKDLAEGIIWIRRLPPRLRLTPKTPVALRA